MEFILSGFTDPPAFQITLFVLFLAVYIVTLLGNVGLVLLIRLDSQLQTPMYFFLSNLAFVDFWYSTFITPKFLADQVTERKAISYAGCVWQYSLTSFFGVTESFLLAVMAYNRYMAICNPLLYTAVMSLRLYVQLVAGLFLAGFVNGMIQTITTLKLSFCGSNVTDLFFCDISPLLALSCSETHLKEKVMFAATLFISGCSRLTILVSYSYVLVTILHNCSAEGRCKAFSTGTPHITLVSISYGTILFMYLQPAFISLQQQDQ
ncbi:olfactory receptor 5G9-like [Carettochelys insculpta]|uniref:olfactory receptor 5G9-like n=1 Tax=Carettochelys insculpta TaxID=44489 RepID=UPI003EBC6B4E